MIIINKGHCGSTPTRGTQRSDFYVVLLGWLWIHVDLLCAMWAIYMCASARAKPDSSIHHHFTKYVPTETYLELYLPTYIYTHTLSLSLFLSLFPAHLTQNELYLLSYFLFSQRCHVIYLLCDGTFPSLSALRLRSVPTYLSIDFFLITR